eukprot:8264974-Alexandrium_andersonii.AAC.1
MALARRSFCAVIASCCSRVRQPTVSALSSTSALEGLLPVQLVDGRAVARERALLIIVIRSVALPWTEKMSASLFLSDFSRCAFVRSC